VISILIENQTINGANSDVITANTSNNTANTSDTSAFELISLIALSKT
jgi:hypothetical protein